MATDRTVAVRLTLDTSGYIPAAVTASKSTKELAAVQRDAAMASKQAAAALKASTGILAEVQAAEQAEAKAAAKAATERAEAYQNSGKKMLTAGAVLVAGFAAAEKVTSDFDKALSGVNAVSGASADQMAQLSKAALAAGRDTVFTATQAADAEGELAKAGVSVTDSLGGALQGSLSLAAAGQISVADSATDAANAMNTFGLKGSDVAHIADVYAAAANKSAADVSELAYAMQQGGLVASQMGLSFEDATATLAAFADRGLKGADAGTSLKTMLERLANPTTQSADLMRQLGINVYDSNGKFIGITAAAGQLHDKLGTLTDQQRSAALATIFGSDAIRGATVLYNLGADGMRGYVQSVNDAGAANRMSSLQLNNLSGDLHQLKGSIDVALIQGGSAGNDVLRSLTQTATAAVNAFAALPKPVQEAAVGFAGGGGAALLLVGGLTNLAGKVGNARKALQEMSTAATGMKGVLASAGSFLTGPWGIALAGAAGIAAIFASKQDTATAAVTDFKSAIEEDTNSLGAHTTKAVAADLASKGLFDSFGKLGVSSTTVTNAALGNADAMRVLTDATKKAMDAVDGSDAKSLNHRAELASNVLQVKAVTDGLHDQLANQQKVTAATQQSTAATGTSAAAQAQAADMLKNQTQQLYAAAAARRADGDAANSDAKATTGSTSATAAHAAAAGNNVAATNAAATATKAKAAAAKGDATATKDATRATDAQAAAAAAQAKAQASAAAATRINSDANANGTERSKANAAAARDAAAAARATTTANNDAARASAAAATATDKHATATKDATKADLSAEAAAQRAASAQLSDAQAAELAAQNHQWGATAIAAWAAAADAATGPAKGLDDSVTAEVAAMKDAKTGASDLKDALDALNGVHIAASRAALDVQAKVDALNKSFHENGKTLDITTTAGRANMGALLDLAQAANTHAQSVAEETGSLDAGNQALAASRDEFDKVLSAAGLTTTQIDQFNKTLLNTPTLKTLRVDADTSAAFAKLRQLQQQFGNVVYAPTAGLRYGYAGGGAVGMVTGSGSDTSDNIPVNVSPGEYIVRAAAVRRIGVANLDAWNFGPGGRPGTFVRPPALAFGAAAGGTAAPATSGSGAIELRIAGGTDSAVATMIMKLVRTGQIQLVTS